MELSPRQQDVVAAAITVLAAAVIVAAVGSLFWLAALFFGRFSHVFLPLAVAAVVALVCMPYFEFLRGRLRLPAPVALAALFLTGLIPIAAFAWFFGALIAGQLSALIAGFPGWWERMWPEIQERWPAVVDFMEQHPVGQRIRAALVGQQESMLDGVQYVVAKAFVAGKGALRGVGLLFSWAVMPVYLIFFLLAGRVNVEGLERHLPFLKPDTRADVVFLMREFITIVVAFFRGQLVIAFLQGLLFAVGFAVVGLELGLVLGLLLGFLNIIPYLGSIVGMGVALPLAFFQDGGGFSTVVAVLVVFTLVQLIEAYVLTPRIMGGRTGLHPMAIIVAVFFWGSAFGGILGMILAIPLTAFLVVFWRLARDKYIAEWV